MNYDLDAERQVLGACLLSPDAVVEAAGILTQHDFHRGMHGDIFAAVLDVHGEQGQADPLTVDRAVRRSHPDMPNAEIPDLLAGCYSARSVVHHARRVAALAYRRRIAVSCRDLATVAESDADDITYDVSRHLDALSEAPREGLRCLSVDQLRSLEPPEWVVAGHIPAGFTVLWGPSEAGKSFVATDWACSVASGSRWLGQKVRQSSVVYVSAEGDPAEYLTRLDAWVQDRQAGIPRLRVVPDPVVVTNPGDFAQLSGFVGRHDAGLVVLDTLARCMDGNENDTEAMGAFIRACDRLRSDRGCALVVVHHCGVDESRMRGNSSLFAAADCVVRCVSDDDSGRITVDQPARPQGKQRNAKHFAPWHLKLREVGDSCVLSTVPYAPPRRVHVL